MSVPSNLVPVTISNLPAATTPQGTDLTIIVQDGYTKRTNIAAFVGAVAVPATRAIYTGTGLSGGGDLSQNRTIYITDTGVVAGTYGSSTQVPIISVNAQGQITSINTTAFTVDFASITNKPTTLAGYGITDAQPLSANLTALSTLGTTGLIVRDGVGSAVTRSITNGTGITVNNGSGLSGNPQIVLADTAVTPGLYGGAGDIPVITIDQQGRITSAGQTTATVTWSNVSGTPTTLAGYGITDAVPDTRTVTGQYSIIGGGALSSNVSLYLDGDAASPGNSKYYGTDSSGTKGWYAIGSGGTVTQINTGTGLTGGPITTTGTISIANTGVSAATYGTASSVPTLAINAQGQVTSATNTAIGIDASQVTTGTLNVARGGTGLASYTVGDLIYASGATSLATLSDVATGNALISGGVGIAPSWGKIGLSSHVSGTLGVSNGGTGQNSSLTQYGVIYAGTTSAMSVTGAGTTGQVLVSNTGAAPSWSSTIPSTAGVTDFSGGSTGLTPSTPTAGSITLGGTLAIGYGGTGQTTASAAFNALSPITSTGDLIIGNGTNSATRLGIGANTYVLTSNGTTASWQAPTSSGVSSISFGTTGLTPATATTGAVTVAGTLAVANGGTGATNAPDARTNLGAAASGANSDITSMTGLTGGISTPTFVQFDTAATYSRALGKLMWDSGTGALTYGIDGGNLDIPIGQSNVIVVKNDDTVTLTAGMVVYLSGANGTNILVKRALATSDATSASTLGVVMQSIATNATGYVCDFGIVHDLNTNAFNAGDTLYLSPTTAGDLTNVQPQAPEHIVVIGYVTKKSSGNGEIFVSINNGWELNELHNVRITSQTTGDILVYDGTVPSWINYAAGSQYYSLVSNGAATKPTWQQISLTAGVTGTLPVGNGGTGATTFTANGILYGNTASAIQATAVGATGQILVGNTGSAPSWANLSSSAVTSISFGTTGLTPATATQGAVTVAGTLVAAYGGTGQSSYTTGDILYASGATALSKLAAGTANYSLISNGAGSAPSYQQVSLTAGVTGTLPIGNGGTNATTAAAARTNLDVDQAGTALVYSIAMG